MLDIITAVAVACVPLLGAWITSTAIPWIRARTTSEQRKIALAVIKTAVAAAEQLLKSGVLQEKEDRLPYVERQAEARLLEAGVRMGKERLRPMIEEAVLDLRIRQEWAMAEAGTDAE